MPRLRVLLLVLGLLAGATPLSGCGNKGPLYLPDGSETTADMPETDDIPQDQ